MSTYGRYPESMGLTNKPLVSEFEPPSLGAYEEEFTSESAMLDFYLAALFLFRKFVAFDE